MNRSSSMLWKASAVSLAILMAGCSSTSWNNMSKADKGTAVGATGGAVAGALVGGPIGAVAGAGGFGIADPGLSEGGRLHATITGTSCAGGVLRLRWHRTIPSIITMPTPGMSPSRMLSSKLLPALC